MGLFGPLDYLTFGDMPPLKYAHLYGMDPDATAYSWVRPAASPIETPATSPTSGAPPAGTSGGAAAASPASSPLQAQPTAAALPSVQSLGTFTTRRTQLFGPLGGVSI